MSFNKKKYFRNKKHREADKPYPDSWKDMNPWILCDAEWLEHPEEIMEFPAGAFHPLKYFGTDKEKDLRVYEDEHKNSEDSL